MKSVLPTISIIPHFIYLLQLKVGGNEYVNDSCVIDPSSQGYENGGKSHFPTFLLVIGPSLANRVG